MMRSKSIIVVVILVMATPCQAETIIVDPNGFFDFTTIQAAIDYSWDGDTVIVRPSTYNEEILFNGRRITLTSLDPDDEGIVDSTIITASTGPAVTFDFSEDSDSIITGFTITGHDSSSNGNGIYCWAASPTITKNIIRDCYNSGIRGASNASPTISSNKIINNGTGGTQVSHDGGINHCNGLIYNNIISDNVGYNQGGGLGYCDGIIINNTITGNTLSYGGTTKGSGIFECYGIIKNNIIAFNIADNESGIYNSSSENSCDNSYNAFWENENGHFGGSATAGIGDIVTDPLFATGSDYHLKSTAGRWTDTGWVLDGVDSRCIDAGDPSDDIGLEPNPNGGRINIGAYGGTSQASKSPSGISEPICTNPPSMDTNNDCKIDMIDFSEFALQWLTCGYDIQSACWE